MDSYYQNNNFARASRPIVHWPSLHYCDMNLLYFTLLLYGVGEHNTEFSFPFSKLVCVPFSFNPRKLHLTN